jgi:hypothetical protein
MLTDRLAEYISACFTGIWIESHEHEDALAEIAQLCRRESWQMATWDVDRGLRHLGQSGASDTSPDPLAAIRSLGAMASEDGSALLVLTNFHRFLGSAEIVQALVHQIGAGKQNRTFVMVLSPVVQIPIELEKLFVVIEHELPNREQLDQIARGIAIQEGELPEGPQLEAVLDASSGLTRYEAEGAFSLSLVRRGRLAADAIWELKTGLLKKTGLLSLHRSQGDFSSLGGLTSLKAFCRRSLLQPSRGNVLKRPRGVLLLGIPGVGKSALCKALGAEVGRPTLILDVGAMYGSLVGETERNIRHALHTVDAMQPAILMIDEIEKALSGAASSGQTDSGVSARLFGSFLTWLSDHDSDVYVVASCNDISKLPPEFARAERWDAVFFIDLPARAEKDVIWQLYLGQFQLDSKQRLPSDDNWTGAEIRACCRLAALLDLPLMQAAQNVVPVAVTAAESVERLRKWAGGRCLSADQPGVYARQGNSSTARRRVSRDPSQN